MPAHSFQAPTLIGCQIFKEQGNSNSVTLQNDHINKASSVNTPLTGRLLQATANFFVLPAAVSAAEKRDYEGVFNPCQVEVLRVVLLANFNMMGKN